MQTPNQFFAGWLRDTRKACGMSQSAVAAAAGVSLATLHRIESGTSAPDLDMVVRLAAVVKAEVGIELSTVEASARHHTLTRWLVWADDQTLGARAAETLAALATTTDKNLPAVTGTRATDMRRRCARTVAEARTVCGETYQARREINGWDDSPVRWAAWQRTHLGKAIADIIVAEAGTTIPDMSGLPPAAAAAFFAERYPIQDVFDVLATIPDKVIETLGTILFEETA